MKGTATLSGTIKHEFMANVLKTDSGMTISLRLKGDNAFEGKAFTPFVGQHVTVTGLMANSGMVLDTLGDLKVSPHP